MKINTKKTAFIGVLSALAIILSFVEALLPPIWSAVPGIKLGLPNIIIIFALYKFSFKDAACISAIRLCTVALLYGNAITFVYSFAGAVLSLAVMWILEKIDRFSAVGVSVAGGVFHNLGQVLTAVVILGTKEIGFYFPVLAVTGSVAGIFVGLSGTLLMKYTSKMKL